MIRSVREHEEGTRRAVWEWMSSLADSPTAAWGAGLTIAAAIVASLLVIWTRESPRVAVGRVMDETRLVRSDFERRDPAGEAEARDAARNRAPRVYAANTEVLAELQQSLESLPAAVASATTLERLDASLRERFALTPELLLAVQEVEKDGRVWKSTVSQFMGELRQRPVLDEQAFQRALAEGLHTEVVLVLGDGVEVRRPRTEVVNLVADRERRDAMRALARDAGFTGALAQVVVNRVLAEHRPTFRFDETRTAAAQADAAAGVRPVPVRHAAGQVIFKRGDTLTAAQHDLFLTEMDEHARVSSADSVWPRRLGLLGASSAITGGAALYVALFVTRIRRSAGRMISACGILVLTLAAACVSGVVAPGLTGATSSAPIVLTGMIFTIAYGPRVALAFGTLLAMLVALALDQSLGSFCISIAGLLTAAWRLADVRDRRTMITGALGTGIAVALATMLTGVVERPFPQAAREIVTDAVIAGASTLLSGGVTLFVLPLVERLFDVATGLTLIELRDPKQPLLRELQQRAPGTYNHSLNVAAIAEAAADAIGANSLLTYAGALYHDIGKMNKPEYFVENRSGGANKHDRLSPALSLLVIIGHVKDGVELASEFGLPRTLRHFIEAHHGTTLVEYFYHRARAKAIAAVEDAEVDDAESEAHVPDEVEYRYPGPRPQTPEVAIVMIADAVESATRSLPDPTPARIESLVRELATKRLIDGQFDECDLTLRDVNNIVESVSRTMTSIYHGRIAYPTDRAAAGLRA